MKESRFKFRAWNGRAMEYGGFSIHACGGLEPTTLTSVGEGAPIMQYTGLKDVAGVEIYEGDIVEFTYWWFDGTESESNLTGTIVYSDHSMSFQLKGVKNKEWERHTGYENDTEYLTPFSELNFVDADFHVLGNIHQHKELLE
jgi:uncharacterized phage protein (TIGR01671 family)